MTVLVVLLGFGCAMVSLVLVMTLVNLGVYRTVRRAPEGWAADAPPGPVAVCVPARNEASNIEHCVGSILATGWEDVRVLVYDDHSTDGTGEIVDRLAAEDPRVVRVETRDLPEGWNGKQFGCSVMGGAASALGVEWLLFTDADVRFGAGAIETGLYAARRLGADLVSTFPRQITGTLGERLVVPMIHFVLFGYLPMPMMRTSTSPAASAGCGQYLLVRREAYEASAGHGAFRDTMHDGIMMPRRLRECGLRTDLFDGTGLVECRMYRGMGQVWRGFSKNAYEGLGSPAVLAFFTLAHLTGHVLPWAALFGVAFGVIAPAPAVVAISLAAIIMAFAQRAILCVSFRQSWAGVAMHPVAVLLMTLIQWHSLVLSITGRRSWRGRRQGEASDGAGAKPAHRAA